MYMKHSPVQTGEGHGGNRRRENTLSSHNSLHLCRRLTLYKKEAYISG